ncbi:MULTISPECIES: DUF3347 domain-containing protein [Flavobacteriaceae]|jgi:hypothetical protein|uniref:DUF3347 domain-containing protein n=3 Tax=Flavobacteriaceae TaxID=49546 RepID=A0ABT6FXT8_9FLAO|nr:MULTISPECIES: DUF3347 domain-containing protein [Flavobacteriaceae]MCB0537505.1 DUF3347 domain-containing protein [Bacteroidota bacterium]MDX1349530.1 DUF3347 domain-containing protein [Putridiphycobacter sp.]RYH73993.1 DUF3347 domain-containing protein [Flavobacteriaceae bacterium 144Ye]MDG4714608.1 DUF3347 domain-containing protein [Winogradskyella sp. YYF002]NJX15677.1 DUF3347 domain-containing protein [Tamlana crocina]
MSKLKLVFGVVAIAFVALTAVSCKDAKTDKNDSTEHHSEMNADGDHSKMNHDNSDGHHDGDKKEMAMNGNGTSQVVLNDYFNLKDALVADDNAKAKNLGGTLAKSLKAFDTSKYSDDKQSELKDIIEDATEHAEHISESDIAHQREHFKVLSKDMVDMVEITGTSMTIYQQYCPMYDNNKGGAWLSMNKEIRNPYFGDKMLKCGKVQREIN